MISWRGQLFCHRVLDDLRSDSFGSTNRPQLIFLDIHFSNRTSNEPALLCFSFLVTVTESHRGVDSERGASSTPSGQLQGRQQESQEAPASIVHPFLTYSGQRPLGGGEQERGGVGQKGVKGGLSEEGFVLSRSSWV